MTEENDIRLAYINTLLDGGYTHLADGTTNPTEGYIVGGLEEESTMYSTCSPTPTIHYAQFKELWVKHANMGVSVFDGGVGTWIHGGKIYFDIVQQFHHKELAIGIGQARKERAIYDCANQKEILL